VGLLAALLGVQRGLEVHVYDLLEKGPKPGLVKDLGAVFHTDPLPESGVEADVLLECTGAPSVVLDTISCSANNAITCLTGVSGTGRRTPVDLGQLNRTAVLENDVVFGTVNANRRRYLQAAEALAQADQAWLGRLITRRTQLEDFAQAFEQRDDDVKVVIDLQQE
jgi:threonine dehydrogenase-like Zn-dependent dehydrogenase